MVRLIFSPKRLKILEYQHSNTTGTTVETWPNGRITRRCPSGDTHIKFPDGTHCSSTKRENFNINSLFHVSTTSFKLQEYILNRSLYYIKSRMQNRLWRKLNSRSNTGTKADVWSSAVILYALLAGNLPFGQNLLQCPRFVKWNEYCRQRSRILGSGSEEDGASAFKKVRGVSARTSPSSFTYS